MWKAKTREYELEKRKYYENIKVSNSNTNHPLLIHNKKLKNNSDGGEIIENSSTNDNNNNNTINDNNNNSNINDIVDDPLRSSVIDDPLRLMMNNTTTNIPKKTSNKSNNKNNNNNDDSNISKVDNLPLLLNGRTFEPWNIKKTNILQTYTTNKHIAVSANFLEENKKQQEGPKSVDETARLELLETDPESEVAKQYMSQKEYITHIEEQHENLKQAWDNGERVLSLKIAIQCAKLLGDTKVPAFYPSMYVLLSAILDTFGNLVFERIKEKHESENSKLTNNFKSSDVSLEARETCRNWFFKTACIRELVPRLYIEMCLIRCNRFLKDNSFPNILKRLSFSIRGIGDPLVASYARAYLASKALEVQRYCIKPTVTMNSLLSAFDDFLFSYRTYERIGWPKINNDEFGDNKKKLRNYVLHLISPALQWLLQNIGLRANEDMFFALLQQYKECCNHSVCLTHMISSFDPKYVSTHALAMTQLIRSTETSEYTSKAILFLVLGKALVISAPNKKDRLPILNEVWRAVTKIDDVHEYCQVACVFIEYLIKHFSTREVNIFLKDVIKHVKKAKNINKLQDDLYNIVTKILDSNEKNFENLLMMDTFLPLLDLLDKSTKILAAKQVLISLSKSNISASDPVILHTLFDVARTLHDSLDSLSFDDERRQISDLIISFIRQINFGRDLEKHLSTYVECRQAFSNLDAVIEVLVKLVILLAVKANIFMKGKHNKKTSAFVKACLAYCHITVPSLDDIFVRLDLFLECTQVALTNSMVVQAEAYLKAVIAWIADIPANIIIDRRSRSTEERISDYIHNFISLLVVFPGHPEHGPFYLVHGLLNALQKYEAWNNEKTTPYKLRTYFGLLRLFCCYAQRKLPYHINKIESNDRLYGGTDEYMKELETLIDKLMNIIMNDLTVIGESNDIDIKNEQPLLALELVNLLIDNFDMNPHSATLVVRLYQLANNNTGGNKAKQAYLNNTLIHLQAKKGTWFSDIAQKIVATNDNGNES